MQNSTRTLTDTVLVVADGTLRSHTVIGQVLASGRNAVVASRSTKDLVPYIDAGVHEQVWAVVADPADAEQINDIIERATDKLGPVIMVVDPGGQLSDVASADRQVA